MGSLLFAVEAAAPFGINAASFLASAGLVASVPNTTTSQEVTHLPMRQAIGEGLRWLFGHRLLRTLAILLGINTFCFSMATATQVLLATRTLHVTPGGYGILLGSAAVGSIIGGIVNSRFIERVGPLPALVTSLTATAVIFEGISLAPNAVILGLLLALTGFAMTIWNVLAVSLRQQLVPSQLRGRVNSAYRMIGWGPIPLGALTGGVIASTLGYRAPYAVAGILRALALLVALRVLIPQLSTHRQAKTIAEQRPWNSSVHPHLRIVFRRSSWPSTPFPCSEWSSG